MAPGVVRSASNSVAVSAIAGTGLTGSNSAMSRYPSDPRLWLLAIGVGLALVLLENFVPDAYWLIWNLMILLLGLFIGLLALGERYPLAYAGFFIVAGLGAHAYEYSSAIAKGECAAVNGSGWIDTLEAVDRCLDYSAPWVLGAQAFLIAGGMVLAVKLGTLIGRLTRRRNA
jgi:hypothetical protein